MNADYLLTDAGSNSTHEQPDPPLTDCPSWCEKPAGHDWEDLWRDGLIRYHGWWRTVGSSRRDHKIGVEEIEQHTKDGTKRQRNVVLDVEAPTEWPVDVAREGLAVIAEAIRIASTGLTAEHIAEVR